MAEFALAGGLAATMVSIGEVLAGEVAWTAATIHHQQAEPQSQRSSTRPERKTHPGIYNRGNACRINPPNHPGVYRTAPMQTNRLASALEYLNQAVAEKSAADAPLNTCRSESPDLDIESPCPTARLMEPVEVHVDMSHGRSRTLAPQAAFYAQSFEDCGSPDSKLHMTPRETLPYSGILSSSTSACSDSGSTAPYCDDKWSERSVSSDDEWDDEQLPVEIEVKHLPAGPELDPEDSCLSDPMQAERSVVPEISDRHLERARASVHSAKSLSSSLDDDMGSLEDEMADLTRELMEMQAQLKAARRSGLSN